MELIFNPPPPVTTLTPELENKLKTRMQDLLAKLVKKNSGSIFFAQSRLLSQLRDATLDKGGFQLDADKVSLLHKFSDHVPFSDYEDYRPFVSRFLEPTPSLDAVQDLLSPGLPEFLAQTSGTSGTGLKFFPKYGHEIFKNEKGCAPKVDQLKTCAIYSLRHCGEVNIASDGKSVRKLPITIITSGFMRVHYGITLENEQEMAKLKPPLSVAPFAVGMIPSYKAGTFITLFFAVADESLGFISTTFTTLLCDAICVLEEHWDSVLDCIESGSIPNIFDWGMYRPILETYINANPARAADLRQISVGSSAWLKKVWPQLRIVRASASGVQFSAPVPKLRHHFGPEVALVTRVLGATECSMGAAYDAFDCNLYKLRSYEFFEFLDVDKPETPDNLSRCWEVQSGKQYEIVATTQDGLWRYRIGDIIEIAGFSPEDGLPLMRFIERRGVKIRISGEFVTEAELAKAVASLKLSLGTVREFTVEVDIRKPIRAYGFFVELDGQLGAAADDSIAKLKESLFTNAGYKKWSLAGRIGDPTIRVVTPGTFQSYRDWKTKTSGAPIGQIKVPIAISDMSAKEFFIKRVAYEIGALAPA